MRMHQYKPSPMIVAIISIPFIFLIMMIVFWVTGNYFGYPSTDPQKTTAFYAATIFSLLPLAICILFFVSERRGLFAIKAFGTDITFDFSKNMMDIQQLDRPNEVFSPETYQDQNLRSSDPRRIVRAVMRLTKSPVVALDIRDGQSWWLSRLFALTAGAIYLGLPLDAVVFVGTKENIEKTFICWAEPRNIFESILRAYPNYGQLYMQSIATYNQLILFPPSLPNFSPNINHADPNVALAKHSFNLSSTVDAIAPDGPMREITFLDILLSELKKVSFLICLNIVGIQKHWI
jgi:hypothetical protein